MNIRREEIEHEASGDGLRERGEWFHARLEQEMAQEQQQLDLAQKKLAEQQDVRLGNEKNYARVEERLKPFEAAVKLHESNIESLKRELANIK
jgi:hypothetical protein